MLTPGYLHEQLLRLALLRGAPVEPKIYPFQGQASARQSKQIVMAGGGPFVCCGLSLDNSAATGSAGETVGLVADGTVITPPDRAEVQALAAFPGNAAGGGGWVAPVIANNQISVSLEATAAPGAGDIGALVGFHTSHGFAQELRKSLGTLRAWSMTLDSSSGLRSRAESNVPEDGVLWSVQRTGDEQALSAMQITVEGRELVSRAGQNLATSELFSPSPSAFGGGLLLGVQVARSGRVEADITPNGTTPTVYLTFQAAVRG